MPENFLGLKSKAVRHRTVLVLRGTGLNVWHYHNFLASLSLEELGEFCAIYAISGGAVALWFSVLERLGLFERSSVANFDRVMRAAMNRYRVLPRLWRIANGVHAYHTDDNLTLLLALAAPAAKDQLFRDFPLRNFQIVACDEATNRLLLIGSNTYPDYSVPKVLSQVVTTTKTACGTPLVAREPYGDSLISDFDFASRDVKKEFRHVLTDLHRNQHVLQLNILREGSDGNVTFMKVSRDRFPGYAQGLDFILFFLGFPNARYFRTFSKAVAYPIGSKQ
jgi:hypothetical protein